HGADRQDWSVPRRAEPVKVETDGCATLLCQPSGVDATDLGRLALASGQIVVGQAATAVAGRGLVVQYGWRAGDHLPGRVVQHVVRPAVEGGDAGVVHQRLDSLPGIAQVGTVGASHA